MFKERKWSSFLLLREVEANLDRSFVAKVGDEASLKIADRSIDIHALITEVNGENIKANIVFYHPEVRGNTSDERLEQIREDEKYINENNLNNGTEITFKEINIFSIFRID